MKNRLAGLALSLILTISFPAVAFAVERYEILKIGDEDQYVLDLQNELEELGYFHVTPTGYYGTVTQQAVIDYQKDHSLIVDGKAGPQTLSSIMGTDYKIPRDRFDDICEDASYIEPGDRGDTVSDLQTRLKELEYYDYSSITGYFGPVTEQAVKRFQRTNDLTVDGIAGAETTTLLFSDNAKYFCIYPGDRGDDVENLQSRLCDLKYYDYGSITGYFGTVTEHALKEFQAQAGLVIDAKAGKNTRALLYANDASEWDGKDRVEGGDSGGSSSESSVDKMLRFSNKQLGKKYVYSTEGPNTFDCSGLVYYVLKYMGVSTRRCSADGFSKVDNWEKITRMDSLLPGDLLFFKSGSSSRIGHTGIYAGDGEFIHASSSAKCVKISAMTDYYDRNFVLARRVFD